MRIFYFDSFIDAIITSEPIISEPISILQRFDFHNGYGEHTLLTHLRILMKTLNEYTGKSNIHLSSFIEISKSYTHICENDIELVYRIISPELKPLTFRILKKFFISLNNDSMEKIMKCIQKQTLTVTYDLKTQTPSTPISSESVHSPMKYAVDSFFPELTMQIPENTKQDIKTPVPSPMSYTSFKMETNHGQKPEKKKSSSYSWICWIFGCRKFR